MTSRDPSAYPTYGPAEAGLRSPYCKGRARSRAAQHAERYNARGGHGRFLPVLTLSYTCLHGVSTGAHRGAQLYSPSQTHNLTQPPARRSQGAFTSCGALVPA